MPLTRAPRAGFNRRNFADQVLMDCPELYFRFDEGSGSTAIDRSGFERNSTYDYITHGGSSFAGNENPSATNACITFNNLMGGVKQDYSAEALISVPNTSQMGAFFTIGNGNGAGLGVGSSSSASASGNRLWIRTSSSSGTNTGVDIGTGIHHIALTLAAVPSRFSVYLDGRCVYEWQVGFGSLNTHGCVGGYTNSVHRVPDIGFDEFAYYGCVMGANRFYSHWKAAQLGL